MWGGSLTKKRPTDYLPKWSAQMDFCQAKNTPTGQQQANPLCSTPPVGTASCWFLTLRVTPPMQTPGPSNNQGPSKTLGTLGATTPDIQGRPSKTTHLEGPKTAGCGSKPMGSHFGVGAPILVYFSGDWDVHWGYGILTHGQLKPLGASKNQTKIPASFSAVEAVCRLELTRCSALSTSLAPRTVQDRSPGTSKLKPGTCKRGLVEQGSLHEKHLNIALYMVVSLYLGVEKAMFQTGKMYLLRSPVENTFISPKS